VLLVSAAVTARSTTRIRCIPQMADTGVILAVAARFPN
jgi:hypothetical protein